MLNQEIDPGSATPCRAIAFAKDEVELVEANYLGFVTIRNSSDGAIRIRFLAQTTIVETVRFEETSGNLMLVGAGFEGFCDSGATKFIDVQSGRKIREFRGHSDDITDVVSLPGQERRVVTVGYDGRVIVHDVESPEDTWIWDEYGNLLNTCASRPQYNGQFAIGGDSGMTFVLDANSRSVIAALETPGDSNGLVWSEDGRFLLVGGDHAEIKYFDSRHGWDHVGSVSVGGAAKRMVLDPRKCERVLVACYDGRIWGVPERASAKERAHILVQRRRGLWGTNVVASRDRIAVSSFCDRAHLLARNEFGEANVQVGNEPLATFGANWIALSPNGKEISTTHDDGVVRIRDTDTGRLIKALGPDSQSLLMGASFHPTLPILAAIDFYGEIWLYDLRTTRVIWHKDLRFGPGITVDFSPSGMYLAAGGYCRNGYLQQLDSSGIPINEIVLEAPNHGVIKSICFANDETLLAATGDGCLVVYRLQCGKWHLHACHRAQPPMGLSNGVAVSPDGRRAYVVSRDQSLRSFDILSGSCLGSASIHTRSVKTVHVSSGGDHLVTGGYDRTVLVWDPETLRVRLPPLRGANSGVSCVRVQNDVIYSCSFDGVLAAWQADCGRLIWTRNSRDVAAGL